MKKLLVLVFALVLVVSLASVSLAVGTTLTDGKVEVTLSNGAFGQTLEGNLSFDLTKTFSEQLSAGATIKVKPAENLDGYVYVKRAADATGAPEGTVATITVGVAPDEVYYDLVPKSLDLASAAAFDGAGWVKFNYSPVVVTVKTSIDGNAADALGGEFASNGGPGVQVDYTVIEGATVTVMGNGGFNYLAKGVYNANGLKLGAGYQAGKDKAKDALAVFGSYTFGTITVGGEYASRSQVAQFDSTVGSTAMMGSVAATFGPLTVNGKFQKQDSNFKTMAAGDADGKSAYDAYKVNGYEGMAVLADVTYKVTDAISVYGAFQDILSGKQLDSDGTTVVDVKKPMSYKVGVTYALTENCKVDASYKSIAFTQAAKDADLPVVDVDTQAINLTATHTFAAGLVGSLSLDMDLAAETQSYTAKVTATL